MGSKEFRVNVNSIRGINLDKSRAIDFTDYYIKRGRRVRKIGSKFFVISTVPGSIIKKKKEIRFDIAKKLIKKSVIIIRKKGFGHVLLNSRIKGYCERVSIYKDKRKILSEIQIEFELNKKYLPKILKLIDVKKVINKGLFDYAWELM